jgi:hypothetical protein
MEIRPGLNPSIIGAIDEMEIDKLIFKVITIIHSSKSIAEISNDESDYRECLKERYAISEMILSLTSLAIIMRNKIENMSKFENGNVGQISNDLMKNEYEALLFKDACNKIIHSKILNVDMKCIFNKNCWYLNPQLHCYGEYRKVQWVADIDIEKYCENIYKLTLL